MKSGKWGIGGVPEATLASPASTDGPHTTRRLHPKGSSAGHRALGGSHLLGPVPFCEEVFLQRGIGLHLPPGLIPHTQPPAQGQANESGCKGDKVHQPR